MKLLKWFAVFAAAFILAWILIFTFIQEPFKQTAAARVLTWWTPQIPIYLYVAGAFVIGFGAGLCIALVNYVGLQSKLHHKTKECHELEERVTDAEARLKRLEPVPGTGEHKAISFDPGDGADMTDAGEELLEDSIEDIEP